MVERFYGTWKLNDSENFDDYLKEVGVLLPMRLMASASKPTLEVKEEAGGMISVKASSTFSKVELKFKLGEECEDNTADGRKAKSTFTYEDGKLVQKQAWDGKTTTLVREIQNGELLTTCEMNGVVSVRKYMKIN
ncbi:fatty acid binding protein 4b [Kryptolebias marmoratus]|uniref:Cellular retinoic acid-binding protein 1 n=1 Tax=Kryptolebias marmoratus TaxID=37003 RepID=A0A3Q3AN35_KRYMA|nr:fatty acid binding protein 4b [Kryptolebias marmoratus]